MVQSLVGFIIKDGRWIAARSTQHFPHAKGRYHEGDLNFKAGAELYAVNRFTALQNRLGHITGNRAGDSFADMGEQSMPDAVDTLIRAQGLPAVYRQTVELVHHLAAVRIAQRHRELGRAIVVGLSGSQGSGKSTMAAFLEILLKAQGLSTVTLSIDDLYLTLPKRQKLAEKVHPLLRTRGVPGTHEVGLGMDLIDVLCHGRGKVSIPRFDKAEDTRAPSKRWPRVVAPVDVILFEGWCVGAIPQSDDALTQPVNALEGDEDADGAWRRHVNEQLKGDYAALFGRIDILALLKAPSFEVVFEWRSLQERKLAERVARENLTGTRIMSPDQIRRFLMFYQRLTERILAEMPGRADIIMPLDESHRILGVEFRCQF